MISQFARLSGGAPRRGSTLVVVLALLSALMLLGFLFLTIASQEQENAFFFSEAGTVPQGTSDDYFGFALDQLILGPRDDLYNSALWGGRASLLPTLLGNDLQAYNGTGINLLWDSVAGGYARVDQDFDGQSDELPANTDGLLLSQYDDDLVSINLSPAAWAGEGLNILVEAQASNGAAMLTMPAPDAEYTYPDLNSPFLSYIGYTPDGGRVVIPSFHRPQYLRDTGLAASAWYTDVSTSRRSMRPHRSHMAITDAGTFSGESRFVDAGDPDAADIGAFPFDTALDGSATVKHEGIWEDGTYMGDPEFDADPDNDGIKEAVLIDLDYPVQQSADGAKTFVPIYAITIYDADALFNLNVHGNAYGDIAFHDGTNPLPFGDIDSDGSVTVGVVGGNAKNEYISRSNQGTGPQEVNLQVGLDALVPTDTTKLDQHSYFLNRIPTTPEEIANLELWFTLVGRAQLDASRSIQRLHAGRWGEEGRLRNMVEAMANAATAITAPQRAPYPGSSGRDDDDDRAFGGVYANSFDPTGSVFPITLGAPAHRHPLDLRGQGDYVTAAVGGKQRQFLQVGRINFPQYLNYFTPPTGAWAAANLVTPPPFPMLYSVATTADIHLLDHPRESDLASTTPNSGQDALFTPADNATLHLRGTDQDAVKFAERLLTLVPYNFRDADANFGVSAADRRRRYTTTSADLKSYGQPRNELATTYRGWEYTGGQFPPVFPGGAALQPFRQEARGVLANVPGNPDARGLMRKLSVNHVAEQVTNPNDPSFRRIRLRPLTPHPITALTSAAVLGPSNDVNNPTPFGSADATLPAGWRTWDLAGERQREWNARRDRQNLARDLYVLLYTLDGMNASDNTAATATSNPVRGLNGNSATPFYSPEQCQEMAQFAVNLVDTMDSDDVMTAFVYDINLADGFTTQDDAYGDYAAADPDRRVVYGVEAQKLAFGEALVAIAQKVVNNAGDGQDHELTEWDDSEHRDFAYLELANFGPGTVEIANNWQIVATPNPSSMTAVSRRLTIEAGAVTDAGSPTGPFFTIGTVGDAHNRERASSDPAERNPPGGGGAGDPRPSFMQVDTTNTQAAVNQVGDLVLESIAPLSGQLNLDLLDQTSLPYSLYTGRNDDSVPAAGDEITAAAPERPGGDFLSWSALELEDAVLTPPMIEFVLRRRLNLNRAAPSDLTNDAENRDNPWIEIDRISVPAAVLSLDPTDETEVLKGKLRQLRSSERREPLRRVQEFHAGDVMANPYILNSLGDYYPVGLTTPYGLWQPHYDRPLASLGEVLGVPLYGPTELTAGDAATADDGMGLSVRDTGGVVLNRARVAAARVLFPDGAPPLVPGGAAGDLVATFYRNVWYRLFEFLEVPATNGGRSNFKDNPWFTVDAGFPSGAGDAGPYRAFGKINLNTLRHPHVLAGVLDDYRVFRRPIAENPQAEATRSALLPSVSSEVLDSPLFGDATRRWWADFLYSRDGLDPVSTRVLPGLPALGRGTIGGVSLDGHPFRNAAMALRDGGGGNLSPSQSLQDTVFRTLPGTSAADYNSRSLFELGSSGDADTTAFDFTTRYRLLSKVLSNTTTRSNVYLGFIQVEFFKAKIKQDAAGDTYVRIGELEPDSPGHRAFFVIDRTKAVEVVSGSDLPQFNEFRRPGSTTPLQTWSFARNADGSATMDWRPLVVSETRIK